MATVLPCLHPERTLPPCGLANLGCFQPKSNSYTKIVLIITPVKISLLTPKPEVTLMLTESRGCHGLFRLHGNVPTAAALSCNVVSLWMMPCLDFSIILPSVMSYFIQIKLDWSARNHFYFSLSLREKRLRCLRIA